MAYERLILMRDLLAPDGCIYVHCDNRVSAYLRLALDEIFGRENFRNAVVWHYRRWTAASSSYQNMHDLLMFYSKGTSYTFNPVAISPTESQQAVIDKGYNVNVVPSKGGKIKQLLVYDREKVAGLMATGQIDPKNYGRIVYVDRKDTVAPDVWTDIQFIHSQATERLDYPTQKPETLLSRVIEVSSNKGDLVADFFCGSGTTASVAEKLGRKWIGTDLGKFGIHTTRKRLIGVQRELKDADKDFRAFEVLNLGRYERQAYLNIGGRLSPGQRAAALAEKEREFRDLILRAYKASPLGSEGAAQDGFFHGARNGRLVVIGPINLPVGRLFVEEVITECRKRGASRVDILAFEFEMGLFPAVLEEARSKGIDLTPKYIPAEVFDKRAVDKGQVVFHDISFVEASPRYDKKNKFAVSIELSDFSVYYTQGAAEAAIAALKEGKSDVICEQGQLYKISKSKDGIVNRERLTKHWTDWVDYWAVDFDYLQRKEIIKVPVGTGIGGVASLEGFEPPQGELKLPEFEERWTGGYIFENEWQSFRTRQNRDLELTTALHTYDRPGRYTVAVKVIDIFGNDTMTLVAVNVG